jgi:hypothetical protein
MLWFILWKHQIRSMRQLILMNLMMMKRGENEWVSAVAVIYKHHHNIREPTRKLHQWGCVWAVNMPLKRNKIYIETYCDVTIKVCIVFYLYDTVYFQIVIKVRVCNFNLYFFYVTFNLLYVNYYYSVASICFEV